MWYKRREFIKLSSTIVSGLALTGIGSKLSGCTGSVNAEANNHDFGIQLYTVRDDMPKDPKNVLKQLASFGYKQIESYEHDKLGMFWGMKNTEFKKYLDDLGMKLVSSHSDINKDFERKAGEAAAIKMDYLICPSLDANKTLDNFKKAAQKFNECGEICKKNGIGFAYHNHDYSFKPLEGQIPQDLLMKETDPSLVDYEMDIYWVVTAGHDPEAWLQKYQNRFRLCHAKDRIKNSTQKEATCTLGKGSINFPKILETAKKQGMKYFIAEQERYDGTTPLKAAKDNATYMKTLNLTA
jgi:sugar phosphate isomerase/epimerase